MLYSNNPVLSHPRKKVILIIFSGLTTDLINLDKKIASNGSQLKFMEHRCILPSLPLYNLVSILTGAPLEFHGISSWNTKKLITPIIKTEYEMFPTLFYIIKKQKSNLKLWLLSNNSEVINLIEKPLLDDFIIKENLDYELSISDDDQLGVIYDHDLFNKGVKYGFNSDEYQKCLENKIINLNNFIKNNLDTTIIISSTSGGFHQGIDNQGGVETKEIIIPLIINDPYLLFKSKKVNLPTSNVDITAIICYFLGINLVQPASSSIINLLIKLGVV